MEEAETKFIDITKAYKSLTDDTIRENLAKYGNPDGPQQREDKIAIPKWVVEGKSSAWVLLAYGAFLGLGIPLVVGKWWFRQRRLTRDGILNGTAEIFYHQLREDSDFLSLISILSSALEFQVLFGKRKGSKKERKASQARIEELEKELDTKRSSLHIDEAPSMRAESRVMVTTAVARRVRALLWAHLLRVEIEPELQREQLEILRSVPTLLNGLTNIALAHNWLNISLLCYQVQPRLIQAVPDTPLALAQLPGVSLEEAQELEITTKANGRNWIEKFVKQDVKGHEEAKKVAAKWPRLEVLSAEFKVTGEKAVTPLSIVSLNCRVRYVYPGTPRPSNGEARADSVEVVEKAVDEKKKRSPSPTSEKAKPVKPNGYIHAPHWPANKTPGYSLLLGDSKLDKVIVQPSRLADIPLPNADGTPAEPVEVSLQFQAPPQANLYSFIAHFQSDALVGADIKKAVMVSVLYDFANIQLKVEPVAEEDDSDDDISEPEEDSLAGQMALMRGEKVKPSDVHGGDDESEYETDSSSDEDTPRGGRAINEDTDSDSD